MAFKVGCAVVGIGSLFIFEEDTVQRVAAAVFGCSNDVQYLFQLDSLDCWFLFGARMRSAVYSR
eukprot:scaffold17736_cov62-Phaeocystis_antarctica.AAC.9